MLVVDDNLAQQMSVAELLSCWGIEPLRAGDGGEAVALACELALDLILMDLQMPVLDGLAATRRIRRFEREQARTRVPVVAYSAGPLIGGDAPRRDSGLDGLPAQPCDRHAMHACLVRWGVPGVAADPAPPGPCGPA